MQVKRPYTPRLPRLAQLATAQIDLVALLHRSPIRVTSQVGTPQRKPSQGWPTCQDLSHTWLANAVLPTRSDLPVQVRASPNCTRHRASPLVLMTCYTWHDHVAPAHLTRHCFPDRDFPRLGLVTCHDFAAHPCDKAILVTYLRAAPLGTTRPWPS